MKQTLNFRHTDPSLKKTLKSFFSYDLAVLYPNLDLEEKIRLLHLISLEKLSDMFVELDLIDQLDILKRIEISQRKSLFRDMETDDLKEFIESVDEDQRDQFIRELPALKAKTIRLLLTYEEDTAASIMTTDFMVIQIDLSIKEATHKVVTTSKDNDYIDTIFVVGDDKKLLGVIDLKSLIIARPNQTLEDIMTEDFHFVYDDDSIEKAIDTIQDYDRKVIPVLDHDDHVLGIVTGDDIFDELVEDTEEDYQKMALVSDHASSSTAFRRTRQRLPWLMLAVILNLVIALFLSIFEATIAQITVLVLFQPLILGMAGNIGTQALAVTILGLHLNELDSKKMPQKHVRKELSIGLMNSLLLGVASFLFVNFLLSVIGYGESPTAMGIASVVFIAIASSMFISALMGVFVPILLDRFHQDPSAASGPIMTTINDIVALVIYFGIATLMFL